MTYKPGSGSSDPDVPPGKGLRGPDKQQDEERVQRTGDSDGSPISPAPVGAPEGLRRERAHPLNPHDGRGGVPPHVPGPKEGE